MLFIVIIALFIPSATNAACEQARAENPNFIDEANMFCAPGHYVQKITSKQHQCKLCPAGKYTGKVDRSNEYGIGKEIKGYDVNLLNNAESCDLCVPGTYSQVVGLSCPDTLLGQSGILSSVSSLPCTPINPQYRMHAPSAGAVQPQTCPNDEFPLRWITQDTTASPVVDFVSASSYIGIADPCIDCPNGFVYDISLRSNSQGIPCKPCGPGTENISPTQCGKCKLCTFRSGSVLDTYTPPNTTSSIPQPWPANCMKCPDGWYSNVGATECHPCKAGTGIEDGKCTGTSASCTFGCDPGMHVVKTVIDAAANKTKNSCTACPAGTSSSGTNSNTYCSKCKHNTIAPQPGQKACNVCTPGKVASSDHIFCKGCPPGTYSKINSEIRNCTPCEKGKYSAVSESTTCTMCSRGSYMGEKGAARCITASAGHYVDELGSEIEKPCERGSFQPFDKDPQRFPTSCTKCVAGRYQSEPNMSKCEVAPVNTFTLDLPQAPGLLSLQGTDGAKMYEYCPQGSWTGPSSVTDSITLNKETYIVPLEPRMGVHGVKPSGEWSTRRRNSNPYVGHPNRSFSISTRRRGCNSCPVHWYNDQPTQGLCRECQPVERTILPPLISVTDYQYSDWMRVRCAGCWEQRYFPSFQTERRKLPPDLFSFYFPTHYFNQNDENIRAQCSLDSSKVLIIVLYAFLFFVAPCVLVLLLVQLIFFLLQKCVESPNILKSVYTPAKDFLVSIKNSFIFILQKTAQVLRFIALLPACLAFTVTPSISFVAAKAKEPFSSLLPHAETNRLQRIACFSLDYVLQTSSIIFVLVAVAENSDSNGWERLNSGAIHPWWVTMAIVLCFQQILFWFLVIPKPRNVIKLKAIEHVMQPLTAASVAWAVCVFFVGRQL